jgi:hypothetical protein
LNKHIVEEFYYLALRDLRNGASIQELELAIAMYEKEEDYEACEGILRALQDSKNLTLENITQILRNGIRTP